MISVTEPVAAPPATLWSVLVDVERLPELTPSITTATIAGGGPLGPGSHVRLTQPRIPSAEWLVTEWDEGRGFTWVASGPGVRSHARHRVLDTGDGSRLELEIEHQGPMGWLSRLLFDRRTRLYMAMEAAGLRARAESLA